MEGCAMAGRTKYEQLAISARDFRLYAFEALGGNSITETLQMIRSGFPSVKVIRLAAAYEIPEGLPNSALQISGQRCAIEKILRNTSGWSLGHN
jgi:hypothetical protein